MIVQPGFLDHWKTKALVNMTGDEAAPLMLLRLWAYCQIKRTSRFPKMTNETLANVCNSKLKPEKVRQVLTDCGWIAQDGDQTTVVHDWEVINAQIIASWINGSRGGRLNEGLTRRQPVGIPGKPKGNPHSLILSDKILSKERMVGLPMGSETEDPQTSPTPDPNAAQKLGQQLSELTAKIKSKTSETPQPPGL